MTDNNFSRRTALQYALGAIATTCATSVVTRAADVPALANSGSALKATNCITRKPGMSSADFADYWINTHSKISRRLPGLSGLVMNVVDRERSPGVTFDGMTEISYADAAAYERGRANPDMQLREELSVSTKNYMVPPVPQMLTREIVVRNFSGSLPTGAVKQLFLMKRDPALEHDAFISAWRDKHASAQNASPGIIRFSLNVDLPELRPGGAWDGYGELWWSNMKACEAAAPKYAELQQRGIAGFAQPALFVIVQPHRIV